MVGSARVVGVVAGSGTVAAAKLGLPQPRLGAPGASTLGEHLRIYALGEVSSRAWRSTYQSARTRCPRRCARRPRRRTGRFSRICLTPPRSPRGAQGTAGDREVPRGQYPTSGEEGETRLNTPTCTPTVLGPCTMSGPCFAHGWQGKPDGQPGLARCVGCVAARGGLCVCVCGWGILLRPPRADARG